MANYCNYEIRAFGTSEALNLVFSSMPSYGLLDIDREGGSGDQCYMYITGNCAWSVNFGVVDNCPFNFDLDDIGNYDEEELADAFRNLSLRLKSELLNCKIYVHYWSEESGFDQFDQYEYGKCLKRRKIEYDYDDGNKFDWNELEFVGHEGEFDESVDGEENDVNAYNMLARFSNNGTVDYYQPQVGDGEEIDEDALGSLEDLFNKFKSLVDDLPTLPSTITGTDYDSCDWTYTNDEYYCDEVVTYKVPDGFEGYVNDEGNPEIAVINKEMNAIPTTITRVALANKDDGEDGVEYRRIFKYTLESFSAFVFGQLYEAIVKVVEACEGTEMTNFDIKNICGEKHFAQVIFVYGYFANVSAYVLCWDRKKFTIYRITATNAKQEQITNFENSVINWVQNIEFIGSDEALLVEAKIKNENLRNEVLVGDFDGFNDAFTQLLEEHQFCFAFNMEKFEKLFTSELYDEERIKESVREMIAKTAEVVTESVCMLDEFIEDVKNRGIGNSELKTIYETIDRITETPNKIEINDDIVVEMKFNEKYHEIVDKWHHDASLL